MILTVKKPIKYKRVSNIFPKKNDITKIIITVNNNEKNNSKPYL